jgi:2-desacetyl-2-hydroxyethyl bacteriochlorophyllide A dehydrogenase
MGERTTDAVIFPELRRVRFGEVALPEMGPDELTVQIEYSSISNGTERWCLIGRLDMPGAPSPVFPHVPGYQAAGVVVEVGSNVKSIRPGDRVFSRNCREPEGFSGSWWGGHVHMHINSLQDVIKLPSDVSTMQASALLLAQVGFNGASKPRVHTGDVAVLIGEGLVGQFAGQVLRNRGAYVIMAGLDPYRLDLASTFSADEVFDNSANGLMEYISDRFPEGVPIVLETASSAATMYMATQLLGKHGQLVLNGFYTPEQSLIDWHWLRRKEITLYCPDSRNRDRLQETLRLMQEGVLHVDELMTHRFPAADATRAYELLLQGEWEQPLSDSNRDYAHSGAIQGFMGMILDWR